MRSRVKPSAMKLTDYSGLASSERCFTQDWLANPILIKKKSDKWRLYINFTNLNEAFPKDNFPLPQID